ncbi:MAG TPA: hypothetical protein VGG83_10890 [Trebonia sp.]
MTAPISGQRIAEIHATDPWTVTRVELLVQRAELLDEIGRLNKRIQDDTEALAIVSERYRANVAEVERLNRELADATRIVGRQLGELSHTKLRLNSALKEIDDLKAKLGLAVEHIGNLTRAGGR